MRIQFLLKLFNVNIVSVRNLDLGNLMRCAHLAAISWAGDGRLLFLQLVSPFVRHFSSSVRFYSPVLLSSSTLQFTPFQLFFQLGSDFQ